MQRGMPVAVVSVITWRAWGERDLAHKRHEGKDYDAWQDSRRLGGFGSRAWRACFRRHGDAAVQWTRLHGRDRRRLRWRDGRDFSRVQAEGCDKLPDDELHVRYRDDSVRLPVGRFSRLAVS